MEEFISNGRFITIESFKEKNPMVRLHKDCETVVIYAGGAYIQVLSDGIFYLDAQCKSKSLDKVEKKLWKELNIS
jgi:hypothetical protein